MLNDPDEDFLSGLKGYLGPKGWKLTADDPEKLEEPRGRYHGRAALIARPDGVDEVAEVIRRCAAARVAVLPHSGGTGLVGGQVMEQGPMPVLLSLERMNRIRGVSAENNSLIAEAGVILADVQSAAENVDRLFPLSLASEGSCRIGGNLSTNAGGVQVLRYGNARDLCLGIEAVMPDGSVVNGLKTLRKDNMGYDLRHLMIGAEGTLGVITAAALKLFPRPAERTAAFIAIPTAADSVRLLHFLRPLVGDVISGFELIDRMGLDFLDQTGMGRPLPFETVPKWSVLMEAGGRPGVRDALESALAEAFEAGLATDGAIAQSEAQADAFWEIRESIPEANRRIGAIASHDIAVPVASIPEFIARADKEFAAYDPNLRINCFGHVGDGNLHYNLYPPMGGKKQDHNHQRADVTRIVHDLAYDMNGTVSAEHGVGRLKVDDLERYGDPGAMAVMRAIKTALDPLGIMNPGAVLQG
ncbi:MAG: FAD-binding oxidoreductase [Pikeienuella sp.]